MVHVKNCERAGCGQAFIVKDCMAHCSKACCRKDECATTPRVKRSVGRPRIHPPRPESETHRKCTVCGVGQKWFVAFAPCTSACIGSVWWQSTRGEPGFMQTRTYACHLYPERMDELHRPDQAPRVHIGYCSLRCYNSVEFGHLTRTADGRRRRNRRWRDGESTIVSPEGSRSFGDMMAKLRTGLADEAAPWLHGPN